MQTQNATDEGMDILLISNLSFALKAYFNQTIQKLINQQRYLIIFNILFFFVFSKFKLNCDYFEIATERTRHVYLR